MLSSLWRGHFIPYILFKKALSHFTDVYAETHTANTSYWVVEAGSELKLE